MSRSGGSGAHPDAPAAKQDEPQCDHERRSPCTRFVFAVEQEQP
jgi:hypothetical protein